MSSFEDKIRPPELKNPLPRDLLGLGLLVLLAAMLIPQYLPSRNGPAGVAGPAGPAQTQFVDAWPVAYLMNVPAQMASSMLLPAMGFLLVLRLGGVDLSVWAAWGLGGVVSAFLADAGVGLPASMALAAAAGAIVGLAGGVLTVRYHLASPLGTGVVGLAVAALLWLVVPERQVSVDAEVFELLQVFPDPPVLMARMFIVVGVFVAVLAGVIVFTDRGLMAHRPGAKLLVALTVSGALSAIGGFCWLIDRFSAPVPVWPIGDLRIPAAGLLAGGAFLGGRKRTMLSVAMLPFALLVVTAWRQRVIDLPIGGFSMQVGLLIGMTVVSHQAFASALSQSKRGGGILAWLASLLTVAGVVLLAATGSGWSYRIRGLLGALAVGLWLAGCVCLVAGGGQGEDESKAVKRACRGVDCSNRLRGNVPSPPLANRTPAWPSR